MITFEEAYDTVLKETRETATESIPFTDSCNRILAEDVASDIDMPPFNRSAVDGFACHSEDIINQLEVVETVAAGRVPACNVGKNQCSKVMTGAIVPDGCDIVVMVEDAMTLSDGMIKFSINDLKPNISLRGEDVHTGDIVLRKGKCILPQDIAVLASVGHTEVLVRCKPLVGIISTGDELVHPSMFPALSQIRNSNAYQLQAQVARAGGIAVDYGIAPDNEEATYELICKAVTGCDLLLITGGVSMGDFDFVPAVLERAGVKILFDKVKVQPGKPTTFGVHSDAVIFGLPGNPVSSFIQFEMLVRPLMNRMTGSNWKPLTISLPMAVDYTRKSTSRKALIPVLINDRKEVVPVDYHGSAHISSLSCADGIIVLEIVTGSLRKGEIVDVRQI